MNTQRHHAERKTAKRTHGRWSEEEQRKYEEFVRMHPQLFTKQASKGFKAFKRMSEVIKSRTAIQCRSHHQKMLLKETAPELPKDHSDVSQSSPKAEQGFPAK